ncbi:MAG TPA: hypothetical protein VMR86_00685 [Myxococcota bacterium]|nr:hypothetical protein [Myxococcota bacterium]
MANSAAFDAAHTALEKSSGMDRWAARGAIQLALMDAGLEASTVSKDQMAVVVEKLLPRQLQSQKIGDVSAICAKIRDALMLLREDKAVETADKVFQRMA